MHCCLVTLNLLFLHSGIINSQLISDPSNSLQRAQQLCTSTHAATEGPYFVEGAPQGNGSICDYSFAEQRLIVSGQIISAEDCVTGLSAKLDMWQANGQGKYSFPPNFECRGKFRTDPTGRFKIVTTFPGRYLNDEAEANSYRPAHVHFKITPDDPKYQPTLTTQLYFMHDVFLGANDSCPDFACYSGNPTLIIPVTNLNDVKTFEGRWTVYIKPGGNGDVDAEMKGRGPPPRAPRPSRPPN